MQLINFLKCIWNFIKAWINAYITLPLKGWKSYIIDGAYIQDNERNQQVIEFLCKVSQDCTYEPSTPTEHYLEKHLYQAYEDAINDHLEEIKAEYNGEVPTYEEVRSECAQQIALDLLSYRWIDDSKWDNE